GCARGFEVDPVVTGARQLHELQLGGGAEELVADPEPRRAEIVGGVAGGIVELGLGGIDHEQLHAGRQQLPGDLHDGCGLSGREDLDHDVLLELSNCCSLSGVSGTWASRAPCCDSASSTAEATTAATGSVPDSPTPLSPRGFSGEGVSRWSISSSGMSLLRGRA